MQLLSNQDINTASSYAGQFVCCGGIGVETWELRGQELYGRWEETGQEAEFPRCQEPEEIENIFCNIA